MAWLKLDDRFAHHPKVLAAGPMAAWLHICGLSYCSEYLTDGYIPDGALPILAAVDAPAQLAERLVEVGLWERADGGYRVHDYLEYNPSREQVLTARAARSEAGSIGGQVAAARRAAAKGTVEASPDDERADVAQDADDPGDVGGEELANAQANEQQNASKPVANARQTGSTLASKTVPRTRTPSRTRLPDPGPDPPTHGGGAPPPRVCVGSEDDPDEVAQALAAHFAAVTGQEPPRPASEKDRRAAEALWARPLREIAALAGSREEGERLIDAAVRRLEAKDCIVKAPLSIVGTARALAGHARAKRDRWRRTAEALAVRGLSAGGRASKGGLDGQGVV